MDSFWGAFEVENLRIGYESVSTFVLQETLEHTFWKLENEASPIKRV